MDLETILFSKIGTVVLPVPSLRISFRFATGLRPELQQIACTARWKFQVIVSFSRGHASGKPSKKLSVPIRVSTLSGDSMPADGCAHLHFRTAFRCHLLFHLLLINHKVKVAPVLGYPISIRPLLFQIRSSATSRANNIILSALFACSMLSSLSMAAFMVNHWLLWPGCCNLL